MKDIFKMKFSVDTQKSILSSQCQLHKTERFVKETRRFLGVDKFISKLSEAVILHLDEIITKSKSQNQSDIDCFKIETENAEHTFYFRFGYQLSTDLKIGAQDIIFFKYFDSGNVTRRNDQRFVTYLQSHLNFHVIIQAEKDLSPPSEFRKLYNLSNSEGVNFPLLNEEQHKIVTLEDQNVLVQGVAGSGKTNICINKIIFTACRAYAGKILYTTFSRGLLIDTKQKTQTFIQNLIDFTAEYEQNRIVFTDKNHKKAIENKLGIYFSVDDDDKIVQKIKRIITFLQEQVDYYLLEDMYKKYFSADIKIADENYFIKHYVKGIKNHQLAGNLRKVKHLSYEVIFKEIYGLIMGSYDPENPKPMLSLEEYTAIRKESFSRKECETIYLLANDYSKHLIKNNLLDNNFISRRLLEKSHSLQKYSLAIIDEVQDMTEVSLSLMKSVSRKMFCVGDALQMINPSYFSFAYLKRMLFQKDVVSVAELTNNYRNSKRIEELIEELGKINIGQFGTHSFVLKGQSVDTDAPTSTVYVEGKDFIEDVSKQNFDNFTVIVGSAKQKEELRKLLKKQEILTVAEIKGLERDTVILYNVLSDNLDKWQTLERTLVNRKIADENSVYRYYFNLFYVGVSRAKSHLYVAEDKSVPLFDVFFKQNFKLLNKDEAVASLTDIVSKIEDDQDEVMERVSQFINLGQFDNARFAANKILDDVERTYQLNIIEVTEMFIYHGKYRDAGIRFWEKGMLEEAKKQFKLSGDQILTELLDACRDSSSDKGLDVDILQFYLDVENNEVARKMILHTVQSDLKQLSEQNKAISSKLKTLKEKKYG